MESANDQARSNPQPQRTLQSADAPTSQSALQSASQARSSQAKKAFVEPRLARHETLPEVTGYSF